ncbi:MAG: hypothetical protein WA964_04765 [Ilumatobacter sp.]|uniref:hypothetical protein n=1 Tax=Ilumatobacter sp. TaxID=1967498 RepID=UPI003C755B4B
MIVIVALCGSVLWSTGSASAATDMAVTVGYGGYVQTGRAYPVSVEVTADELFTGVMRFSTTGAFGGTERAVEFAGGTVNDVEIVLDQSPFDNGSLEVQLIDDDGTVVEKTTVRPRIASNSDLVGVFPGAIGAALPEKVSVRADAGDALLFPVGPETLDDGWGVLDPLDAIVVTADDLRDLDDDDLDMLTGWINTGGRLHVDEPVGSEIPGLPPEWQPIGAAPHAAGHGEIMLTNGAAAAGDWQEFLEPAPSSSRMADEGFGDVSGFYGGEPLSWSLGRDAGFSLPSVTTMIVLLIGYVLLVGPLLWLVLRVLHRPGLAWALVPVTAIVVTGVIWVAGSSYRSGVEVAQGTVVQVGDRGSVATTFELVNSRTGAAKSIDLPADWLPTTPAQEPRQGSITVSGDEQRRITTEVDAGGFAVLGGTGPASEFDGAVEVSARSSEPGQVVGTITNHLDIELRDVGIFADSAGKNVGDIGAGESVDFELTSKPVRPNTGQSVEFVVWPGARPPEWTGNFNTVFAPGEVNMSLWGEFGSRSSVNARGVGDLVVGGWTNELPSPIDDSVTLGRTLVMARSEIIPSGDALTNVSVQRDLVRGSSELGSDFTMNDGWGGGAMVRFVVPDGAAAGGDLVLQVPASQRRIEIFDDGEWKQVDVGEYEKGVFTLPATAVDGDRVYVKVLISFDRAADWRDLSVRSRTDADDTAPLMFATEVAG